MIKYFIESIWEKLKLSILIAVIVLIFTGFNSGISILTYFLFCIVVVFGYLLLENIYFYIKNKSYKAEHDYYRELPRNYSPSIVSFLTNLKIEYKKDVLADLIFLEQKKILKINQDKTIKILNTDYTFLNNEKHLRYLINELELSKNPNLDYLLENKKDHEGSFRKLIIEDAFSSGLLTNYYMQKFGVIILLIVFFAIRIFSTYSMFSISSNINDLFKNPNVSDFEIFNSFMNIQNSMISFSKTIPMFFMAFFIVMILTKIMPIIRRYKGTDYMRSKQGKKDVGLWLSYSKFIKDFSIMEERNLEEKELWGYYFAYGLALGINKKTIKKFGLEYENFIIN